MNEREGSLLAHISCSEWQTHAQNFDERVMMKKFNAFIEIAMLIRNEERNGYYAAGRAFPLLLKLRLFELSVTFRKVNLLRTSIGGDKCG